MKKTKFFLLGLAALSLAACNKDNGVDPIVETDATVSFVIKTGEGRAVGDGIGDAKITKLTAMVYHGQVQEGFKEVTNDDNVTVVEKISCKSGQGRVLVVVANHSENLTGKTLAEVEALTTTLTEQNQSAKGLIMTGKSEPFEIKAGDNYYGYDSAPGANLITTSKLAVTRVHAGMTISNVEVEMAPQYSAHYKFKAEHVAGLVCKSVSKIFGSSLVFGSDYLGGVNTPQGAYTPVTPETYDNNTVWLTTSYGADKGFYILENDYKVGNTLRPTILCVYGHLLGTDGQPLEGDALTNAVNAGFCDDQAMTYYPVLVNADLPGYTYTYENTADRNKIVRNNHYKIALKITGPGTNTPEDPVNLQANLYVQCTVTPWVVVNQNATW